MNTKTKPFKITIYICLSVLSCLLLYGFYSLSSAAQRQDFLRIASEQYDTVFLSMYPTDTFDEADWLYFRAMTLFKADYVIPGFSTLRKYLERIAESGNMVTTVYLGIRPDKISTAELALLPAVCPSASFEVIISYPSLEYWTRLSRSEYERTLTAYRDFLSDVCTLPGTRAYFFAAEEWLISNPSLYSGDFRLTADAARFIMTNSDYLHSNQVTPDNTASLFSALEQLTASRRNAPVTYPDLKDTAIVFFGDSMIGNFTDRMSIPGVVCALTGATVYNCGYGGNPAAMNDKTLITLPGITAAFAEKNLSVLPPDTQVYAGMSEYIASPQKTDKLCFVISYGLNDYFNQHPISSQNLYDVTTYSGAVRTAVICLQKYYPLAQIILCTPTYTAYANDAAPNDGRRLEDYVDTIIDLARELDVDFIDNYRSLGIDRTNYEFYLSDTVHLNEAGRFLFAQKVINAIR